MTPTELQYLKQTLGEVISNNALAMRFPDDMKRLVEVLHSLPEHAPNAQIIPFNRKPL